MFFSMLLKKIVKRGSLTIVDANGKQTEIGDGSGTPVIVRLHDATVSYELALNPYLKLGEAYMDGRLTIDKPATIYEMLDVLTSNLGVKFAGPVFEIYGALRRMKRRIDQHNPVGKAEKNVAHHYDLDGGIYDIPDPVPPTAATYAVLAVLEAWLSAAVHCPWALGSRRSELEGKRSSDDTEF